MRQKKHPETVETNSGGSDLSKNRRNGAATTPQTPGTTGFLAVSDSSDGRNEK